MASDVLTGPETVADLIEQLGVPPERIRMNPLPGKATERDVIEAEHRYNRLCELVDGVLVEKAMGFFEARLAHILGHWLESHLDTNPVGLSIGADALLRMGRQIRLPDLSFFFWNRFPDRTLPEGQVLKMCPDFAVEVLSPSNTAKEMSRKRDELFAQCCQLVWEVDPPTKSIEVFQPNAEPVVFNNNDTVTAAPVLPGFAFKVGDLFTKGGRA